MLMQVGRAASSDSLHGMRSLDSLFKKLAGPLALLAGRDCELSRWGQDSEKAFFLSFLAALCSVQDLTPLTRDQTPAPCSASTDS